MIEQDRVRVDYPASQPGRTISTYSKPKPETRRPRRISFGTLTIFAALVVAGIFWATRHRAAAEPSGPRAAGGGGRAAGRGASFPVPVTAGTVVEKQMPIYLDGLGTVQAFNTVTIRPRVDGQIVQIAFTEGQEVHAGDLLAVIDPAPFQAQLDQAVAKRGQDQAQVEIAKITLQRNAALLADKILAQQDYDTQKYLVDQLQATVKADEAAMENARVQLGYTKMFAPIDGRVGIRLVDQGNIVQASSTNGVVVLTQLRPISVVFTIPERFLPQIQDRITAGDAPTVLAVDRDNRSPIAQGKLSVVDNLIDTTTGTLRLKATFLNQDGRLWPGQFVNARLQLEERKVPVVPAQVVQRGPNGAYAFVIKDDSTVEVRAVKVDDRVEQGLAMVREGLHPGERVVVDGQYKCQPGSKVIVGTAAAPDGKRGPGRQTAEAQAS